jgi:hypothetical protein
MQKSVGMTCMFEGVRLLGFRVRGFRVYGFLGFSRVSVLIGFRVF